MKKIIMLVVAISLCGVAFSQTEVKKENPKAEVKTQEVKSKDTQKNTEEKKLHTLTCIVKNVDLEKKMMTLESTKFKGEVMSFSYEGIKVKDGNKTIDASSLKVGDKVKIKYSGDIKNPKIEKMMIIKEEKKDKNNKVKKEVAKKEETKEVKKGNK
jgi:hypothetical protein